MIVGRRAKIAVLIGTLEVGGAELDIARNFPRLNRDEFEVVVVTFGPAGSLAPELERQGIRVVSRQTGTDTGPERRGEPTLYERFVLSLPVGLRDAVKPLKRAIGRVVRGFFGLPPVRFVLRSIGSAVYITNVTRWVRRTLVEEHADVVHSFLPHSYAYGLVAGIFIRPHPRQVMSRLSLNFYAGSHPILARLERILLHHRVDIAIGNSKLILAELAEEGVRPEKLRLLHNGIDPAPFVRADDSRASAREALGIPLDSFTIVAVGNLHRYKGHGDLIEACALASERLPEAWKLLIAGRDEAGNRAVYESLLGDLKLTEHVTFLGACEAVPQLLHAGDVFVQPSHHEGLPNAVIEAMAASLPVIATTVGGIPEAVSAQSAGAETADETGWLVAPGDSEGIAAALLEAAEQPERRMRMGARARLRVVTEFSLERSVAAYESIYRELLGD